MRRLAAGLALVLLGFAASCKAPAVNYAVGSPPAPVTLSSAVDVRDPVTSAQLVRGLWGLEDNAWRWSAARFSVTLRTPDQAARKGGHLNLKFALPQLVFDQIGAVQLAATVNGIALEPQAISEPGQYNYIREVPPQALSEENVSVQFTTNRAITPSADDPRERVLAVVSVSLTAK